MQHYREFPVQGALANFAVCVWIYEGQDASSSQRIVPDGQCEVIVHAAKPYEEKRENGDWSVQAPALFAGQLLKPLHLRATGETHVFGLRFRPAGAYAFAAQPLFPFTDKRTPLLTLWGGAEAQELCQQIRNSRNEVTGLKILQTRVLQVIQRNSIGRDRFVEQCVRKLDAGAAPHTLLVGAKMTARALQRRFLKVVGLPPRTFRAIRRLRKIFTALQDASIDTWTMAAQEAGYFDHPQMARDFRRFVGCSPSQFVASGPGLAASLVDLRR